MSSNRLSTVGRAVVDERSGSADHDDGLKRLRGTMGYVGAALAIAAAGLAVPMAVLVRRERRRIPLNPEAHRIEAAATRGLRDARRQAHAYQHFADANGVSALRDRDSRS